MSARVAALMLAAAGVTALAAQRPPDAPIAPVAIDAKSYLSHLRVLASDEFEGRGTGTAGGARAAEYIAAEFKKAGLIPSGDPESYFQEFDLPAGFQPTEARTLVVRSGSSKVEFYLGTHFHPLSRGNGPKDESTSSLPVVFAGYGIAAPNLGYDDYLGLDAAGKAVIVFTHEPQENDPRSVFDGVDLTPYSNVAHKAEIARARGARLLIVIEDPTHLIDRALSAGWATDPQIGNLALPVLRLDRTRLSRIAHLNFDQLARTIDSTLSSRSQAVTGVTIDTQLALDRSLRVGQNVIARLEGTDPTCQRAVVVGAHYDHLGRGTRQALTPERMGEVHNGADDNASGTAAVLQMAAAAAANRQRFPCTVVFAAFGAEEIGLVGSRHYVAHPAFPLDRTMAMINLDMIGRAKGRVLVGGPERVPWAELIVRDLQQFTPLQLRDFREGYGDGASDDAPFVRAGVPAVTFFTGFHDDYHRPTDDWERIDVNGATEIAKVALALVERISSTRR